MTTVGIICEYNPFHNGHKKQFDLIRRQFGEDTRIVCLMSGNFVQRGAPAIFDKYTRAKAAVLSGADLVLELPVTAAISSAEGFAQGAVSILSRLTIDYLCFGSESGDLPAIERTAKILNSEEFEQKLSQYNEKDLSYAAARQMALTELSANHAILSAPNDILAVEYCKALQAMNSPIRPYAVRREGSYNAEAPEKNNPSAKSLRSLETEELCAYVPNEAFEVFRAAPTYRLHFGERVVLARLRTMTDADYEALPYGNEGLWRRFMHAGREEVSLDAVIESTKTKRYAYTRICRMLLCAYLGITKDILSWSSDYVRILAADDAGTALIRMFREQGSISLINAGQVPENKAYYALECRCAELFSLLCDPKHPPKADFEATGRIFLKKCENNACNPQNLVVR